MDQAILVEPKLRQGRVLVEYLDKTEFQVTAALWLHAPEYERWRLVIASPFVRDQGPAVAYRTIQTVLEKISSSDRLELTDITVTDPDDPLIETLSLAISTGPTITGIWFTGNAVNGVLIPDAYIYRVEREDSTKNRGGQHTRAARKVLS